MMRARLPLILALLAYVLLTGGLITIVPLGQAPDEAAHWEYVQYLLRVKNLPVFQGQAPPSPGYEYHQPPLYYLLCAPFWSLYQAVGGANPQYACRWLNLVAGLLTLLLIWRTARILFPDRHDIAGFAVGLAALWPLHQAVGAASGNDALAGLVCSALFYYIARGTVRGWTTPVLIGTALVITVGLYTKNTCLVVAVAALAAILLHSRGGIVKLGLCAGIAFLLSLPLLLRNMWLYGDPFGIALFAKAATAGTPGYPLFSQGGITLTEYARGIFLVTTVNAWGVFGGPASAADMLKPLSARGPRLPTDWYIGALFIMLAGSVLAALGLFRVWNRHRDAPVEHDARLKSVWTWWFAGVVLVFLAWVQFSYGHFSGAQARYLHPALLPVCIAASVGWTGFWGKGLNRTIATSVVVVVLLALSLANHLVWKTLV